jgi:hypothetical protein
MVRTSPTHGQLPFLPAVVGTIPTGETGIVPPGTMARPLATADRALPATRQFTDICGAQEWVEALRAAAGHFLRRSGYLRAQSWRPSRS